MLLLLRVRTSVGEHFALLTFFTLTLLGKDFHLKLATRVPVGWGSASLVPGGLSDSLFIPSLAEVIFGNDCRGVLWLNTETF